MGRFRSAFFACFQVLAFWSGAALAQSKADYTPSDVDRYLSLTDPRSHAAAAGGCVEGAVVKGPDGSPVHAHCVDQNAGLYLPDVGMGSAVIGVIPHRVARLRFNGNMRLTFETGSAVLTPHDQANVRKVAAALKESKWADRHISIDGYTDAQTFPQACGQDAKCVEDHNQALSNDRALAAKAYLVRLGVDENRLESAGHGTLPGATVSEADRRVMIRLVD